MNMIGTFWALIPAIVSIVLALILKEVYSSLFAGVVLGGIFFTLSNSGGFGDFLNQIFKDGLVASISDSYNVGILIFLVILGIMVALMNKAGGSAAFGEWAEKHIKTKVGVQIATVFLGLLIFIDDYFNCLTVGSVMKPVTVRRGISHEKLAYIIDSTAAPICIIAPISSWAAAVSGFAGEGENGFILFCSAIPYNFYALFTIVFIISLIMAKVDYGPMAKYERMGVSSLEKESKDSQSKGKVVDLVLPIAVLIVTCVLGMLFSGGFFAPDSGNFHSVVDGFANSDASVGLVIGSFAALAVSLGFYVFRKVLSFREAMECIPEGFKAMVPAILILSLSWTLKGQTDALGAKEYVASLVSGAGALHSFLPAIIFVIACALAFATGTSWGTFGILIPICIAAFPDAADPVHIISISACMSGAVCGDHISPISDTTIMASAGADCRHVNHVSSQMPYALTCAAIAFICYIIAGFCGNFILPVIAGVALIFAFLFLMRRLGKISAE